MNVDDDLNVELDADGGPVSLRVGYATLSDGGFCGLVEICHAGKVKECLSRNVFNTSEEAYEAADRLAKTVATRIRAMGYESEKEEVH